MGPGLFIDPRGYVENLKDASTAEKAALEYVGRVANSYGTALGQALGGIASGAEQAARPFSEVVPPAYGLSGEQQAVQEVGRGLLKGGVGLGSTLLHLYPPVAALSAFGGATRGMVDEAGKEGYLPAAGMSPQAVETAMNVLRAPDIALEKKTELVNSLVGDEDLGNLANLASDIALFKAADKVGNIRGALPSSWPGSTRPGAVSIRNAPPIAERGMVRAAPDVAPSRPGLPEPQAPAPQQTRFLPGPRALEGAVEPARQALPAPPPEPPGPRALPARGTVLTPPESAETFMLDRKSVV